MSCVKGGSVRKRESESVCVFCNIFKTPSINHSHCTKFCVCVFLCYFFIYYGKVLSVQQRSLVDISELLNPSMPTIPL